MASDSHEIKITSDLQETVTHKVEGPPDLDAAIRSHLNALQGEGNIPGAPGSAANEALDTSQVSSADAFGPGGQFGSGNKGDENSQPDLAKPTSLYSSAIKLGAAQANASPAITQASPPAGAGQANNMASSLAGVARTVGTALQSVGTAAGGLVGTFLGLASTASLWGAAVMGFTGALGVAEQFIDSMFQSLASNWEGLSPSITYAQGVSEMELTAKKLSTENQVSDDVSAVTAARTDLQSTFIALSATIINTIAPTLEFMMETLSAVLEIINVLLKAFNYLTYWIQYGIKVLAQVAHLIGMFFSNDTEEIEPSERSFKNVFGPMEFFQPDLLYDQGIEKGRKDRGYRQRQDIRQSTPPFDIDL